VRYVSTRGEAPPLGFMDVTLAGLARDGGLYVPETWPRLSPQTISGFAGRPYAEVAVEVIRPFVGDSIPEADRQFYAAAYAAPDGMRASFEVFHTFPQDAQDFASFAKTKLTMPMLVLTGEKASGQTLIDQAKLVDDHVEAVVIKGSGHWLMEEATDQVIPKLVAFLKK